MATRHVISLQGLGLALAFAGVGCSGNEGVRPPSYEPVSAVSEGNTYTLTVGDLRIAVDAALGARITEFSYRGTNVLTGPEVNIVSYGSTYWPSPQSSWCAAGVDCWPPISAIDNNPWTGSIDASTNVVTLTSGPATIAYYVGSEVTVSKRFTPVPANGAIDVTYTLTNTGGPPVFVAPWQVSRVAATGGLTFFGQGEGTVSYATGSDPAFVLTAAEGALWYQFAPLGARSKAEPGVDRSLEAARASRRRAGQRGQRVAFVVRSGPAR